MDRKLLVFMFVILAILDVQADFFYNRMSPKKEDLEKLKFKCIPGRTIIKVEQKPLELMNQYESSDEEEERRRSHVNFHVKDETCKICVCSMGGEDEYCSRRPAKNVNECMRMSMLMQQFQKNSPFEHERALAFRIRRDYIWHKDEIPYESKAKCARGTSYYSNSYKANDTDIEIATDIESLLDYPYKDICWYCVCTVDGKNSGCIARDTWYCEYYRIIRQPNAMRDRYRNLFQQDRPAHFRQLSHRLRRTMDEGIILLIDNVGSDIDKTSCVPYVSQYTDCSDTNRCSGCTRCTCDARGAWLCSRVQDCSPKERDNISDSSLDAALAALYSELENKDSLKLLNSKPAKTNQDLLLDEDDDIERKILTLMKRKKRSIKDKVKMNEKHDNNTVKFYHTVDELNEDTLKKSNVSGTLKVNKVEATPLASRRTGVLTNNVTINPLHIQYNEQKKVYDHHITDNKIDSHTDENTNAYREKKEILGIVTNQTQKEKDRDLSKLIANELNSGTEVIGDKKAPVMSNITFTPENDTLTAMAFIAGNLLNKLWSMEKDSSGESVETEALKQAKIADLLDLFKEPLNLRQEYFLKSALKKLSEAIEKNKNANNISLCKNIEDVKDFLKDIDNSTWEVEKLGSRKISGNEDIAKMGEEKKEYDTKQRNATADAVLKINKVLGLIKKFEGVHKNLNRLKKTGNSEEKQLTENGDLSDKKALNENEHESVNLFGSVLEKITKLILPRKSSKKLVNKIRNKNMFAGSTDQIKTMFKNSYNIDLGKETLSTKDRLILDYLTKIQSNPKCFLDDITNQGSPRPNIEGDILLNLSQFFKIKSFVDLLRLLETEKLKSHPSSRAHVSTTTNPLDTTTTNTESTVPHYQNSRGPSAGTKERLKTHLKTILDDLIELQKESGLANKGDLNIAKALPCIYNILNTNEGSQDTIRIDDSLQTPLQKIAAVFDSLKNELKLTSTRRNNDYEGQPRPKSAIVWERVVKNINVQQNENSRRSSLNSIPKTQEELESMIEEFEKMKTNTYKNEALYSGVPPVKRLMLLKTLEADVQRYISVMKHIKSSLDYISMLPREKRVDINNFVENAATSIILDKKVIKSLNKSVSNKNVFPSFAGKANKYSQNKMAELILPKVSITNDRTVKLSRNEILNQLIKNRINLYLKVKENQDKHLGNDESYNIARNIKMSLDSGNYRLARELYKVFVANKQIPGSNTSGKITAAASKVGNSYYQKMLAKEPLIKFEDQKDSNAMRLMDREQVLKQLLTRNNMRI